MSMDAGPDRAWSSSVFILEYKPAKSEYWINMEFPGDECGSPLSFETKDEAQAGLDYWKTYPEYAKKGTKYRIVHRIERGEDYIV